MEAGVLRLGQPGWLPFVGRVPELAMLVDRLDAAVRGEGSIVLLAGEPGIGKTRTAEELAAVAERRGAVVRWGRGYEGEGAPAFWPWVQILRAWLRGRDAPALVSAFGPDAADVARVMPELGDGLSGLPPPSSLDLPQLRFRLFDAIATWLHRTAAEQPLLLIFDDLHWADVPSVLLIDFIAAEIVDARADRGHVSRRRAGASASPGSLSERSHAPAERRAGRAAAALAGRSRRADRGASRHIVRRPLVADRPRTCRGEPTLRRGDGAAAGGQAP